MDVKSFSSFISCLECSECKTIHDHTILQSTCTQCGKSLLVRYDLAGVKKSLSKDDLVARGRHLWRYRELLPVQDEGNVISLGEGLTPVIPLKSLGKEIGFSNLWLKDEAFNPTGSFKARGLCLAVSKAREHQIRDLCIPTAGNAGGALAAYAAAAGITAHIYMPQDTPEVNIRECHVLGADVHLVRGVISDAAKAMSEDRKADWFDVSTMKEPYRLEGKKTLGYEIAEQFHWRLPDFIVYPTGGGTGLIGMWKAFAELDELGWIDSSRPKMVAVQSSGCAPIVKAYQRRAASSEFWNDASTLASGLRVPKAFADGLIMKTLYESRGHAFSVSDDDILQTIQMVAALEGILLCPEGAAAVAAIQQLRDCGAGPESSVLLFNTGSGLKYIEVLQQLGL